MEYTHPPLDTSSLIALLEKRGLQITDKQKAAKFLENVSYFRFVSYLRPFEIKNTQERQYKLNTHFEQVIHLYHFDAKLRILLFSAIQEIEISLRSRIINKFSMEYGAFWFIDPSLSIDQHKYIENLVTLKRELGRSKDDFIKEHNDKYGREDFPPAWKLLELASFGCLTKMYFNFTDNVLKKEIARQYGVPNHLCLESWMTSINTLRNICAHHSRIWNRIIPVMPQLPNRLQYHWITNIPKTPNKLYAVFCCLLYWLNIIHPTNTLKKDFKTLLSQYPNIDTYAMGFTTNWQNEPLWCDS